MPAILTGHVPVNGATAGTERSLRLGQAHRLFVSPLPRTQGENAALGYSRTHQISRPGTRTVVDLDSLVVVAHFAGDLLKPSKLYLRHALTGLVRLTARDGGDTVVALVRNVFYKGPLGKDPAPVEVFMRISAELRDATSGSSGSSGLTPAEMESTLREFAEFVRDQNTGLEAVYTAIRSRKR